MKNGDIDLRAAKSETTKRYKLLCNLENSLEILKKLKRRVILTSSNFTPSIYPGKLKINMHIKTCTYTQTGIHNNQKVETTQISSNW